MKLYEGEKQDFYEKVTVSFYKKQQLRLNKKKS